MKTNKKILLITPFVNPYEESSGRVNKLQNILIDNDIDFDLITTNFNHAKKKEFDIFAKEESFIHLKVPKYKTNISIKRFYSHTVFAFKLLKLITIKPNIFLISLIFILVEILLILL